MPSMASKTTCRTEEIVRRTERYLLEHPFAATSELAKNCAISETALYSAFKKSSDLTPNKLRNRMILEKAKDVLITTDKSVEEIADFLQFSSASYFRKQFKQYFRMTPREMRKKYRI